MTITDTDNETGGIRTTTFTHAFSLRLDTTVGRAGDQQPEGCSFETHLSHCS